MAHTVPHPGHDPGDELLLHLPLISAAAGPRLHNEISQWENPSSAIPEADLISIGGWEPLRSLSKDRKPRKCGHLGWQLLAGRLVLPIHGALGLGSASHTFGREYSIWVCGFTLSCPCHPSFSRMWLLLSVPQTIPHPWWVAGSAWPSVHTKHSLEELTPGCWTTFSCSGHDQKAVGVTGKAHPSHGLRWALKQGL